MYVKTKELGPLGGARRVRPPKSANALLCESCRLNSIFCNLVLLKELQITFNDLNQFQKNLWKGLLASGVLDDMTLKVYRFTTMEIHSVLSMKTMMCNVYEFLFKWTLFLSFFNFINIFINVVQNMKFANNGTLSCDFEQQHNVRF